MCPYALCLYTTLMSANYLVFTSYNETLNFAIYMHRSSRLQSSGGERATEPEERRQAYTLYLYRDLKHFRGFHSRCGEKCKTTPKTKKRRVANNAANASPAEPHQNQRGANTQKTRPGAKFQSLGVGFPAKSELMWTDDVPG